MNDLNDINEWVNEGIKLHKQYQELGSVLIKHTITVLRGTFLLFRIVCKQKQILGILGKVEIYCKNLELERGVKMKHSRVWQQEQLGQDIAAGFFMGLMAIEDMFRLLTRLWCLL